MNETKDTAVVSLLRGRLAVVVLALLPLVAMWFPALSTDETVVLIQQGAAAFNAAQQISDSMSGMTGDEIIAVATAVAAQQSGATPVSIGEAGDRVVSQAGVVMTGVSSLGAAGLALFSYLRRRV